MSCPLVGGGAGSVCTHVHNYLTPEPCVFFFHQRNLTVSDSDAPQDTWMFIVQADLLPSYIPIRVANKILFVGESVLMFETNQQSAKQESGTSDSVLVHYVTSVSLHVSNMLAFNKKHLHHLKDK